MVLGMGYDPGQKVARVKQPPKFPLTEIHTLGSPDRHCQGIRDGALCLCKKESNGSSIG